MLKFPCVLPKIFMKLNKVDYGKNLKLIGWPFVFRFKNAEIKIGDNCRFNSNFWSNFLGLYQRTIIVAKNSAKIEMGNNVGISGTSLYAWEGISIGNNTIIGANTKIMDNDFHPVNPDDRRRHDISKVVPKSVKIGENVFIGCNCLILKGTVIGDNCSVGAGSVVSGVFEENCIIAGNPAKIIKKLG